MIGETLVVFFHCPRLEDPIVVGNGDALVFFHLGITEKGPLCLVVKPGQRFAEAIVLLEVGLSRILQAAVAETGEGGLRLGRLFRHAVECLEMKHPRRLLEHRGKKQDGRQSEQYD